jgi:hypothetical protein
MQKIHARLPAFVILFFLTFFTACQSRKSPIAVIWTNQAEFASYTELFNKSQSKYRIVVEYRENPAEALIGEAKTPDIVVGPWLKGEKARSRLIPVEYLFNELRINSGQFYPQLLDLGNIQGNQFLLPVSFNLPALIFSQDKQHLITNDFSLSLDQVQTLSREFNVQKKGVYSRMAFSPRWDNEFLYLSTMLFDVKFEESPKILKWNQNALAETIKYLRTWTKAINTSTTAEDDFKFKYLYNPPYKLVTAGKNLFSYISSEDLFVIPRDKIQNIDFRWINRNNRTPVNDGITYMGICRNAPNLDAAEAFMIWFFNENSQKELLERSRSMGVMQQSFGIAGGFSSIKSVNEKTFPLFYPALLGHVPPADSLSVPRILPNNWETLKTNIVLPYLIQAVSAPEGQENTVKSIADRLADWKKTH